MHHGAGFRGNEAKRSDVQSVLSVEELAGAEALAKKIAQQVPRSMEAVALSKED